MKEALKLALEALETAIDQLAKPYSTQAQYAITAIKAALAQPQQEPNGLAAYVIGCFGAAEAEGLQEALAETTDERLKDLVERRLMYALYEAQKPQRKEPEQEPVAWVVYSSAENDIVWADKGKLLKQNTPFYTTPPQQEPWCMKMNGCKTKCEDCPVEVVEQEPVAWKTMEAKYPSLEKLDIRMGDGSILCDVWPQSDGDFWWAGSGTGEKFIDPKYADVTHWRVHSDTTPPQPEERNFCSRCGKRTADLTVIHTCTPPQERT